MNIIHSFYTHDLDLKRINLASIYLIPKKIDANTITQYRPISLINYSVKIITKALTERLTPLMDNLISHTQTAYIKGRYILDNIVCAHETLHSIKKNNIKYFLFKIDFEKAFDKVNWQFLLEILEGRNFGSRWINWIQHLLYSSRTYVNFNGDPLSHFLFDLVAYVLHRLLHNAQEHRYLLGVEISKDCLRILNLHFTNDTLFFLEAIDTNVEILQWILIGFEELSGLKINFSKCELIPFNIFNNIGKNYASKLDCKLDSLPINYLSFPLHNKKFSIRMEFLS
jgi:Reverse transcriptase (RNA-dependent DNA polymerase)